MPGKLRREQLHVPRPESRERFLRRLLAEIDTEILPLLTGGNIDGMQRIFDERRKLLDLLAEVKQTPLEQFRAPYVNAYAEFLRSIHGVGP